MSAKKDRVIEKVRKLLAMAADVGSPNEAMIAARQASSLMDKYNLEESDVIIQEGIAMGEAKASSSYRKIPSWYGNLIVPVAHLFDCEARYTGDRNGRFVPEFLGMDSDALVASYAFDYLVKTIEMLTTRYSVSKSSISRKDINDYRNGLSAGIRRMIADASAAKKKAQDDMRGTGKELVVLKRELIAKEYNISYKTGKSTNVRGSSAFFEGRERGEKVRIHGGVDHNAQERVQ